MSRYGARCASISVPLKPISKTRPLICRTLSFELSSGVNETRVRFQSILTWSRLMTLTSSAMLGSAYFRIICWAARRTRFGSDSELSVECINWRVPLPKARNPAWRASQRSCDARAPYTCPTKLKGISLRVERPSQNPLQAHCAWIKLGKAALFAAWMRGLLVTMNVYQDARALEYVSQRHSSSLFHAMIGQDFAAAVSVSWSNSSWCVAMKTAS